MERLCGYLVAQEAKQANARGDEKTKDGDAGDGGASGAPWPVVRLLVLDTIGVMCGISNEAIQTVVSTGTVRCVLGLLRYVSPMQVCILFAYNKN